MKSRKLIAWIFAFLPLVITIIVLPMLPDKIPAHFGFDGQVTRYGNKYEMLFIPIFAILFGFFWLLIEKIQKNEQGRKVLFWANISVSLLFTVITSWFLYVSFKQVKNINDNSLVGLLYSLCGIFIISIIVFSYRVYNKSKIKN